ncbi:DUF1611 domain-containing protein, partial [Moorena sp. SIO4A5]|uniref:DUF1611 domain-containing protein n=1 Tax=Moorena sp. SIO4A5 TaxID=2607838 RepID=UPI002600642C
ETVASAGGAFGQVKVIAIALNTGHLDDQAARSAIEQVQTETGLPCTDAVRFGADVLLKAAIGDRESGVGSRESGVGSRESG